MKTASADDKTILITLKTDVTPWCFKWIGLSWIEMSGWISG